MRPGSPGGPVAEPDPGAGTTPLTRALAYAVLGRVPEGLSATANRSVEDLVAELGRRHPDGPGGLRREVRSLRATGRWPIPVPETLASGTGHAQLAAALHELRRVLGADAPSAVTADRPLSADERRLQGEVPPHHGG